MERRKMLAAMGASALASGRAAEMDSTVTYLELKIWKLHNSAEQQPERVSDFLEQGLGPALNRAGGKLVGAFANVISQDGPYYVTISQFKSVAAFGDALNALRSDAKYEEQATKLAAGPGVPFVRLESSLLRCFDKMPQPAVEAASGHSRIFELRTYESQSFTTLTRKVGMFNNGEMQIFERLRMRPVFFGETLVGPRQPNLMYMLSYDNLDARDRLWREFGSDPAWQKLKSQPGLSDPEIVQNISNVILRPLAFSPIR
jgi:hypothetical protein